MLGKPNSKPSHKKGSGNRASFRSSKRKEVPLREDGGRRAGVSETPKDCRIVVGIHSSWEALRVRPEAIREVWLKSDWGGSRELTEFADRARSAGIKLLEKSSKQLNAIAPSHQGVAVMVSQAPEVNFEQLGDQEEAELLIVLDEIVDPHNVGAIMRTAWLMGVRAVVVPQMRSSQLTPSAAKVACGAMEHLPMVLVGNLSQALTELKDRGFWVYGLAGEEGSKDLWSQEYPEKTILVVGSEAKGIRPSVRKCCDELVGISQLDALASYNASVAAAIAIGEIKRQRQKLS